MELQELKDLIRKYNAGIASPEEKTLLENWYDQVDGKSLPLGDSDMRNGVKFRLESVLDKYINQHPDARASSKTPDPLLAYQKQKGVISRMATFRYLVAASIIGIMVIGGMKWLWTPGNNREKTEQQITSINKNKAGRIQIRTIENQTKHVITASLSDGSHITMYPGSVLNYLPEFEKDKRKLYLSGKAIFKVSKDKYRPFTVYAGGIATTALGTIFQVSESAGRDVSVALIEGSIKVWPENSNKNDFVILKPGDRLVVNSKNFNNYTLEKKIEKNNRNVPPKMTVTAAIEMNSMVFKNDRLKDVFKRISEKFDITINVEAVPGIEKELFTGKFLESDSLEFICTTICRLHGYQYSKDGNVLTITRT